MHYAQVVLFSKYSIFFLYPGYKYYVSKWSKGNIIEGNNEPYTTRAENLKSFARNRVFIRLNKSKNQSHQPEISNNVEKRDFAWAKRKRWFEFCWILSRQQLQQQQIWQNSKYSKNFQRFLAFWCSTNFT